MNCFIQSLIIFAVSFTIHHIVFPSCTAGFDILVIGLPDHTRSGIDKLMNNIPSDQWAGMGLKPPTYPPDVFPTREACSHRVVESTGWKTAACRINHAVTVVTKGLCTMHSIWTDTSSSGEFSNVFLSATSRMYQNNDQLSAIENGNFFKNKTKLRQVRHYLVYNIFSMFSILFQSTLQTRNTRRKSKN